ncbi:CYTH and CHAD domain-containing protein [Actinocrispum sp. NPDC049592]|uniref:CYTH and CHAD domain-containing protein n=1 Tax=Actinocrispum sp. NPDC049592 TaxID=3154835 RepID=UPI003424C84D
MTTHAEIERKYEAESDTSVPALDTIPGVTTTSGPKHETLEAIYYDTPDLRLVRSGMTLRRREGGADEGWHLKVPAGPDQREEIRLPLDGSLGDLATLVQGITRGEPLEPVAHIRTNRTRWELLGRKGKLLAEVTDDRVTTDDKSWRELEVELGEGPRDLLDAAEENLRRAGFRRSKVPSKLSRALNRPIEKREPVHRKAKAGTAVIAYIAGQVDTLKHYDILVRQDTDDAVHQMRVATRRLRSALRVYRRLLDTGDLAAELRWLGQRLSPARDLEVQYDRIQQAVSSLPVELVPGPVQARLTRHFGPLQQEAGEHVLQTLRSKRYMKLLDRLDALVAEPPLTKKAGRKARKELPVHLARAHRKTARRVAAGEIHPARKAGKRLRYALEAAVPVLGKRADKARKRAKEFTKLGGEYQDHVVSLPTLRELAMQSHAANENAFTFGLLHGRAQAEAAQVERQLPGSWKRVKGV